MQLTRGLLLLSLAACGSEDRVALEVHTNNPTIASVELFLADQPCGDCDGIAPPNTLGTVAPKGDVAFLTGNRWIAMVDNGVAGFELEASDANAISGKLAAVGFDAVDEPTGFVLDDEGIDLAKSRGQRVVLEMLTRNIEKTAGATPAFAPNDAPKDGDDGGDDDGTGTIITWRAPNATDETPSCLAIERHGNGGGNEFFVPPDDPDCDGITDMECDPHWYMRNEPQTGHACLTDSADPAKPCRIGATSTCVDGQPAVCTPGQAFCVPSIACATAACQTDPLSTACLGDPTGFASAAHVDCTIPIIHNSVSGTDSTCATSSMQSTLDGSALFTNGCSWKWISFPAQLPPSLDDQLDLGIPNQLVGSLTVVGSGIPGSCTPSLAPSLTVQSPPPFNTPFVPGAFVVRETEGVHQLVLPVVVRYVPAQMNAMCGTSVADMICQYIHVQDDSISQCDQ